MVFDNIYIISKGEHISTLLSASPINISHIIMFVIHFKNIAMHCAIKILTQMRQTDLVWCGGLQAPGYGFGGSEN